MIKEEGQKTEESQGDDQCDHKRIDNGNHGDYDERWIGKTKLAATMKRNDRDNVHRGNTGRNLGECPEINLSDSQGWGEGTPQRYRMAHG